MIDETKKTKRQKVKRSLRVRNPLIRSDRLRLSVFRSAKHIYAQIIDDRNSVTVVGVGSYDKELRSLKEKQEVAKKVGLKLAKLAKEKNIETVVFDRGPYKYHGRIAALATGAREGGLSF